MNLDQITCGELLNRYPWAADFFLENYLNPEAAAGLTLPQYLDSLSDEHLADLALERPVILANFKQFFRQMRELLGEIRENQVSKLTLLPGHDKDGRPESFEHINLYPSKIISIVDPTGSGKSRLLQDIEWTAADDTPTKRRILINDEQPNLK